MKMIKTIKNYLHTIIEVGNAQRNVRLFDNVFPQKLKFGEENITVYHMNDGMHSVGSFISMVTENKQVIVDDYFFELSEESQRAILYHEIGHLNDKRFGDKDFIEKYRSGKYIEEINTDFEYFADDFAITKCGQDQVQSALRESLELLERHNIFIKKSIKKLFKSRVNRITALHEYNYYVENYL